MAWVVDEDGLRELGYPAGQTIPDHYGMTIDHQGVIFELKSDDHVRNAVEQLRRGLEVLPHLGHTVHRLGLSVTRFNPVEGYFATQAARLLSHKRLVPASPMLVGGMPRLPVMVEQRRRGI